MIKINTLKLSKLGYKFTSMYDMLEHIESLLEYLESHNKNYTQKQYYKILELKEIISTIELWLA